MPARLTSRRLKLAVARQLGRTPAIDFEVAAVCRYRWPALIRNAARTAAGKPNPNLFYLTCPYLRRELSRLEGGGMIARLEERIAGDKRLAQAVLAAQRRHQAEWQAAAAQVTAGPRLAAAAGDLRLKCLHAHFSFYLAHRDYPLGELIATAISHIWCGDERCRQLAAAEANTGKEMP